MKSCAFFGHASFCYEKYKEKIETTVTELVEKENVLQFYCGARGNFDGVCAEAVAEVRRRNPKVVLTLVLSYMPRSDFELPPFFDDSVYLLEKSVPPKFAIWHTNRALIDICEYVICGDIRKVGGAHQACEYAGRKGKTVINIVEKS